MGAKKGEPRLTLQTLKILGVILSAAPSPTAGADIANVTQIASGTLYPVLFRLEEAGWLESQWEDEDPKTLGRPRRRLYRVTALGARKTKSALRDMKAAIGEAVWV